MKHGNLINMLNPCIIGTSSNYKRDQQEPPHVRKSGFQNQGNYSFWNPGYGMRKLCLWNPENGSGDSESNYRLESRIQVVLTKTRIQYPESGIHSLELQNPRRYWISLHGEIIKSFFIKLSAVVL